MPPTQPLTLIVATTPLRPENLTLPTRLGIGHNGTLPWPRIKADMSFFARVTSRAPAGTTNAIIMGRKTYDSLPRGLRPLRERINVVVTRDVTGVRERILHELEMKKQQSEGQGGREKEKVADVIVSSGLDAALETLEGSFAAKGKLGNVFVIGGGEVYASALRMGDSIPLRIVMTDVQRVSGGVFECDTFFPVDGELSGKGWRVASDEEVTGWVGEEVSSEWREEGDVRIRMVGYERV